MLSVRHFSGMASRLGFWVLFMAPGSSLAHDLPHGLSLLPRDAQFFSVPGTTTINGVPARLLGFHSHRRSAEVVEMYVRLWGQPMSKSAVVDAVVLGKLVGNQWVTVKIKPTFAGGTQGILSVIDLEAAASQRLAWADEAERWRRALGLGAKILDISKSTEQRENSFLLIASLPGTLEAAARKATVHLEGHGFRLEREVRADASYKTGRSLVRLFRHQDGADAQVTVHPDAAGIVSMTINLITRR